MGPVPAGKKAAVPNETRTVIACVALAVLGFSLFMGMPIAAEAMRSSLGFGNDQVGYMASAEYGGMFLAALFTSLLISRVDRRLLAGLGIVLAIICGVASLYNDTFETLFPLRLLSGFGSGIGYAVAVAVVAGTRDTAKNFTSMIFVLVVTNTVILYTFPSLSEHFALMVSTAPTS